MDGILKSDFPIFIGKKMEKVPAYSNQELISFNTLYGATRYLVLNYKEERYLEGEYKIIYDSFPGIMLLRYHSTKYQNIVKSYAEYTDDMYDFGVIHLMERGNEIESLWFFPSVFVKRKGETTIEFDGLYNPISITKSGWLIYKNHTLSDERKEIFEYSSHKKPTRIFRFHRKFYEEICKKIHYERPLWIKQFSLNHRLMTFKDICSGTKYTFYRDKSVATIRGKRYESFPRGKKWLWLCDELKAFKKTLPSLKILAFFQAYTSEISTSFWVLQNRPDFLF